MIYWQTIVLVINVNQRAVSSRASSPWCQRCCTPACTQGIQPVAPGDQPSSQRQFPPVNPPRNKLHLQVWELMLLFQCSLKSKALLTWHSQKLHSPAMYSTHCKDETHTSSLKLLYLQQSLSHNTVMNILLGCNMEQLQHCNKDCLLKVLKIQAFQPFGKEKCPIPASSTLQVSCYLCRLCFRSLSVFFCRCMELLQAVCRLVTSSSFCL